MLCLLCVSYSYKWSIFLSSFVTPTNNLKDCLYLHPIFYRMDEWSNSYMRLFKRELQYFNDKYEFFIVLPHCKILDDMMILKNIIVVKGIV